MVLALPLRGIDPSSHMPVVASVSIPMLRPYPQNDTASTMPMSVAAAATPAPLPLTRAYRGVPLGERVLFSKHSVYKVLSWPFWPSSFFLPGSYP